MLFGYHANRVIGDGNERFADLFCFHGTRKVFEEEIQQTSFFSSLKGVYTAPFCEEVFGEREDSFGEDGESLLDHSVGQTGVRNVLETRCTPGRVLSILPLCILSVAGRKALGANMIVVLIR